MEKDKEIFKKTLNIFEHLKNDILASRKIKTY